jgi:hypothetical protein
MGELQSTLFQPEFNRSIRVEARAERVSADAGGLWLRELMERNGLVRLLLEHLGDVREAGRTEHPFAELLLTWLLLDMQGWSEQLDVTELRDDPLFRLAVSTRRGQRALRAAAGREPGGLCSQPTLSRLLQALALPGNRAGLGEVLLAWAEGQLRHAGRKRAEETLDLDSLPVVVHGQQPGSEYNGHYHTRCYHPLLVRTASGFYLGAKLRAGMCIRQTGASHSCCRSRAERHAGHGRCGFGWTPDFRNRSCCAFSKRRASATSRGCAGIRYWNAWLRLISIGR